jgi:hypothetical protein
MSEIWQADTVETSRFPISSLNPILSHIIEAHKPSVTALESSFNLLSEKYNFIGFKNNCSKEIFRSYQISPTRSRAPHKS